MINFNQKEIDINQIDFSDRSYIFSYEPTLSEMRNSIQHIGLIHPPILEQKSKDSYRIISGLRRVLTLKQLKIENFAANVIDSFSEAPDFNLFLMNLYENIATRELNVIEKAIVLKRVLNIFELTTDQVLKEIMPILKLGSNIKVMERYLALTKLEDFLKLAVIDDFISIENAIELLELSPGERCDIYSLFQTLKLGKNKQKEILRFLQDISKMNDVSVSNLANNPEIKNVLTDESLTTPVKSNRIKEILKKMRYPTFAKVESKFNDLKKDLALPPNITMRPPAFFEGEKFTIEFAFKNQQEFENQLKLLNEIAENKKLGDLEDLV